MHLFSVVAFLDLLLVLSPRSTSTMLPPPDNRIPCNPLMSLMGFDPPVLSAEAADPKIESKVKNAKLKRFPRFRIVVDNPILHGSRDNIVVIVAGDPREREIWSETARTHFGQAAFIFNNLFSIQDLAETLSRFPEGGVGLLAFGGHGEYCDGGVFMGIKDPPEKGRLLDRPAYHLFGEHINVENLMSTVNKKNRATITRSLAKGAHIEFHVCIVGQERNLLNFAEAFQRRCWANPGDVGDWGDGQYPWFFKDPPKSR